MSMFDLVVGNTGYPPQLMGLAGLEPSMVARYRDHWVEKDGERTDAVILAVYTRLGGGNRPDYTDELDAMHALPSFISDEDDAFDATYCTLRFRVEQAAAYAWLDEHRVPGTSVPTHEVWEELLGVAEPLPRDMAVIWEAIIQANGAGADGD